jgi:hypothetical protein
MPTCVPTAARAELSGGEMYPLIHVMRVIAKCWCFLAGMLHTLRSCTSLLVVSFQWGIRPGVFFIVHLANAGLRVYMYRSIMLIEKEISFV